MTFLRKKNSILGLLIALQHQPSRQTSPLVLDERGKAERKKWGWKEKREASIFHITETKIVPIQSELSREIQDLRSDMDRPSHI